MPAMQAQPGMPLWLDLATTDIDAAKRFYAELVGWEYREHGQGYAVATKNGMPVAGIGAIPEEKISMWGLALYTPNVTVAHNAAVNAGARSVLEPRVLGAPEGEGTDGETDRGEMAVVIDPSGAAIGLKNPADEHALFAAGEPGTPVWHELMVGQGWDETLEFYHELAGWDIRVDKNSDGSRYALGEFEGAALVGFWDTQQMQLPSMWTLYLGVVDIDAAVDTARGLGAQIVREPFDSEFGRVATITDPTGALLNLTEVEEYVPDETEDFEPDLFADL